MALSDVACRGAAVGSKDRKLADGGGLYLLVRANGSKLWQQKYRFDGKERKLSHGPYPLVTLAEARKKRDAAKLELIAGRDPSEKVLSPRAQAAVDRALTFGAFANEWWELRRHDWSPTHAAKVWNRVKDNLLPRLGARRIDSITPMDVIETVRVIEARGALEMSHRVRWCASEIFAIAKVQGVIASNPASADIRIVLKKQPPAVHMAMLDQPDLVPFYQRLGAWTGRRQTALAIELLAHTALRTQEMRLGCWSEIEADVWRIPGARMKKVRGVEREHIVPLTTATRRLLAELRDIAGRSPFIFPDRGTRNGIAQPNFVIFALYDLGYRGVATAHGFRRTFSTIANESGRWNRDWIEMQIHHVDRDPVRGIYNAAQYLPGRAEMMAWYSDLLDGKKGLAELLG